MCDLKDFLTRFWRGHAPLFSALASAALRKIGFLNADLGVGNLPVKL
jgi:hypothetical protein